MAILTAGTYKTYANITVSTYDAQLALLTAGASQAILQYIGRPIEQATYTEFYSGKNNRILNLRNRPITAVASVYSDMAGHYGQASGFTSDNLLTAGTDYQLVIDGQLDGGTPCSRLGQIERINGIWPARFGRQAGALVAREIDGGGNIKVTYTAGYATVPADIVLAACEMTSQMLSRTERGMPLASESLGGYSYSLATQMIDLIGGVRSVLDKYRDIPI